MILTKLKQRTLRRHQQLEKKLGILHHVKTFDDYRRLLGKFLGFYEPAEAALEAVLAWSAIDLDFQPRKKTPLLLRDLHSLGIADTLLLPRCRMTPMLDTLPRAFGCLYVFESATLGGQITTRHLSRTLGVTPEDGGAFFNSYGDRVVTMWRDFGLQIKAYATKPDIEEAIIRAAVDTFICMDRWMTGSSVAGAQLQPVKSQVAEMKAAWIPRENALSATGR
jgi:heme oxygenase